MGEQANSNIYIYISSRVELKGLLNSRCLSPLFTSEVPTYNETENLRPLCERLFAACKVQRVGISGSVSELQVGDGYSIIHFFGWKC